MKVGLVQYSPEWENVRGNIAKLENLLTKNGDDLLIFPEMTLTGFTMHPGQFAEEIDGEGFIYFIKKSAALKKHIFAGIIEKDDGKFFNSLIHFDDKGLITARYRKIHLFSMSGENKFYSAGADAVVTKTGKTKIGLSICYDLRFPELYRFYAKEKTEVIVDIANWPVQRIEHWKHLLKARAIENQCFMIGVNRTGTDPFNKYNGCSAVYDPLGNEILLAGDDEKIFSVELELETVTKVRTELPFLNDIKMI